MIGLDILIHPYIIVSCDFIGSPSSLSFLVLSQSGQWSDSLEGEGSHIVLLKSDIVNFDFEVWFIDDHGQLDIGL